jgi:hypothetical protein
MSGRSQPNLLAGEALDYLIGHFDAPHVAAIASEANGFSLRFIAGKP